MPNVGKIQTTFSVDGERLYKQTVREINGDLKQLNAEVKLVTERYKLNADSAEGNRAKQEALQRVLETQKEKVDLLQRAHENAEWAQDKDSEAAKRLAYQLTQAQTEMAKTENALKQLDDAQEDTAETTDETSGSFKELIGQLGDELPGGAGKAIQALGNVNVGALTLVGGVTAVITAIANLEGKLTGMTRTSAAFADDVLTQSLTSRISTQALQEYRYAAGLMDVSVETITGSQTKLIKSMESAKEGTGEQAEAFAALNVAVTDADGQLKDSTQVFWDVIDALGEMDNATERDATAMALLGKSATDLNPLINAGSEGMAELADEAHRVGYVLSDEQLSTLGAVDDAYQRLDKTMEASKNRLALQFAPSLTEATDKMTEFVQRLAEVLERSGVVESFGTLLETAADMLPLVADLAEEMGPVWAEKLKLTVQLMQDLSKATQVVFDFLSYAEHHFSTGTDEINAAQYRVLTGLGLNAYSAEEFVYGHRLAHLGDKQHANDWRPLRGAHNAAGTGYWRGGPTWVGESGPELLWLPRGSAVASAQESRRAGGDVYNVTVDARSIRELTDVARLAKQQRRLTRMGGAVH